VLLQVNALHTVAAVNATSRKRVHPMFMKHLYLALPILFVGCKSSAPQPRNDDPPAPMITTPAPVEAAARSAPPVATAARTPVTAEHVRNDTGAAEQFSVFLKSFRGDQAWIEDADANRGFVELVSDPKGGPAKVSVKCRVDAAAAANKAGALLVKNVARKKWFAPYCHPFVPDTMVCGSGTDVLDYQLVYKADNDGHWRLAGLKNTDANQRESDAVEAKFEELVRVGCGAPNGGLEPAPPSAALSPTDPAALDCRAFVTRIIACSGTAELAATFGHPKKLKAWAKQAQLIKTYNADRVCTEFGAEPGSGWPFANVTREELVDALAGDTSCAAFGSAFADLELPVLRGE
jgi:hypothetical protein